MTKDEALDLALESLETLVNGYGFAPAGNIEKARKAITAIKQALAAPPTHKTARWTDEEYREISDQVISTLVEYGAELRTADCQMQILREELAESRREVAQLKAVQEPFGYFRYDMRLDAWVQSRNSNQGTAFYTTPPAAQRQHLTDGSLCWCEPETSYTDPETGASVVVHKGPQ